MKRMGREHLIPIMSGNRPCATLTMAHSGLEAGALWPMLGPFRIPQGPRRGHRSLRNRCPSPVSEGRSRSREVQGCPTAFRGGSLPPQPGPAYPRAQAVLVYAKSPRCRATTAGRACRHIILPLGLNKPAALWARQPEPDRARRLPFPAEGSLPLCRFSQEPK
jgi:hypothetical protein